MHFRGEFVVFERVCIGTAAETLCNPVETKHCVSFSASSLVLLARRVKMFELKLLQRAIIRRVLDHEQSKAYGIVLQFLLSYRQLMS